MVKQLVKKHSFLHICYMSLGSVFHLLPVRGNVNRIDILLCEPGYELKTFYAFLYCIHCKGTEQFSKKTQPKIPTRSIFNIYQNLRIYV